MFRVLLEKQNRTILGGGKKGVVMGKINGYIAISC